MKNKIGLVLILSVLLGSGTAFYLYQFSESPANSSKVTFELTKGMHASEISAGLERVGAVRSGRALFWLGKMTGGWFNIKAAEYEFPANVTPLQIFKILKSGVGIQHSFLVKEGDNIYQVAEAMQQAGLGTSEGDLALMVSPRLIQSLGLKDDGIRSLEGYLFPNTYFYDKREKPEGMIRRMVQAFLRTWTPELEARARDFRMNRKQVITFASIIEKETGAPQEREIISSVFHNRLDKKMRLQSDPTTIYGMWDTYEGKIHRSDLLRPTEYNTYTIPALPPGPISNPHSESIHAALYPAETQYLYFVSRNDGTHVFSQTYGEHNGWVRKLQLDPAAREGKSWRDLNKKK